jgi:hypothetical protein
MAGHWEHFPHEADVGIRGFGATPADVRTMPCAVVWQENSMTPRCQRLTTRQELTSAPPPFHHAQAPVAEANPARDLPIGTALCSGDSIRGWLWQTNTKRR